MDLEKMPARLLDALRKRGHSDGKIAKMDGSEAFSEYCMWHGLIGWGPDLYFLAQHCAGNT